MNARAYSIAAVGEAATPIREVHATRRRDAGDMQAAVGILTGIAVSLAFWIVVALIVT